MSTAEEVRRVTTTWKRKPPIHVVACPAHFPSPAPDDADAQWSEKHGVHIVESPSRDTTALLAHEVVAHHGVRALLGPRRWPQFMAAVLAGVHGGDLRLRRAHRCVERGYGDLAQVRPRMAADESIANMAEVLADPRDGRLRVEHPLAKRWAAVRGRVLRDGLHCSYAATAEEVEGTLLEAQGLIWDGWIASVPPWRWHSRGMETPKPMGPARPARSLEESQHLLRAAEHQMDGWHGLMAFFLILLLVVGVPLWLWWVFDGVVGFLRLIFAR